MVHKQTGVPAEIDQSPTCSFLAFPRKEPCFPLRLTLHPGKMIVEVSITNMLIGRHSSAELRLPLPEVSRRHCRIRYLEDRWEIIDLNSLNGTFVNDEPISQTTLRQGDVVVIGGFRFTVGLGVETEAVSPPGSLICKIFKGRSFNPADALDDVRRVS